MMYRAAGPMRRQTVIRATVLVGAILALSVGRHALDAKVRHAAVTVPTFEVDPMWPQPLPHHLGAGQRDRGRRRRTRPRICRPSRGHRRLAHYLLCRGAAGDRVRSRGQCGFGVGWPARRICVAGLESRHFDRQQGECLDRRQRTDRLEHPQVHARRPLPDADRNSKPGREQQRDGPLRPRRKNFIRLSGERGVHRRCTTATTAWP